MRFMSAALAASLCLQAQAFAQQPEPTPASSPAAAAAAPAGGGARDPKEIEAIVAASQAPLHLYQVLDELFADLAHDLGRLSLRELSPLSVRSVHLSPSLPSDLEEPIAIRLATSLATISGLEQIQCTTCFAIRSRVEGGEWVVTRGIVRPDELRVVAHELGVRTFLDVTIELYEVDGNDRVAVSARVVRAADSVIVYAQRLASNETTAALARSGHAVTSPEARRAELEAMLLGKPSYGHTAVVGILRVPYESKSFDGMISGISIAYRLYEMFGERRANLFGLQMEGFLDPMLKPDEKGKMPAAGATFTAIYLRSLQADDQRLPVVRVGFNAGGFIGGTLGNSIVAGANLEVLLRYRLALSGSLFYVVPTKLDELDATLGGLSYRIGGSFNWE